VTSGFTGTQYQKALADFERECSATNNKCFQLPERILDEPMHLDPDFENFTYGDDR